MALGQRFELLDAVLAKKKIFSVILTVFLFLTFSQTSTATLLNFSGSWASSGFGGYSPDPFSGSFSFEFDDSVVDPSAPFEIFADLPLDSLSLNSSTIGTTVHDLTNSRGFIRYLNGGLEEFGVGGIASSFAVSQFTDDFGVFINVGDQAVVSVANANLAFIGTDFNPTFTKSVSRVPEPTTLALLSFGLAGIGYQRRKTLA